jgi:hypothetical protein
MVDLMGWESSFIKMEKPMKGNGLKAKKMVSDKLLKLELGISKVIGKMI